LPIDIQAQVSVTLLDSTAVGSGAISDSLEFNQLLAFVTGTGPLGAQVQYRASRTMAGSSENLDLAGGLANAKGKTVTLTKVKGLLFFAAAANSGNVTVKFNPTNGLTTPCNGEVVLPPGAVFLLATPDANGWAVTAGTGDIIQVQGASGRTYEVCIFGEGSEA
jgi:hypothetical protein